MPDRSPIDPTRLFGQWTSPQTSPLVPEIPLFLGADLDGLWQVLTTEARAAGPEDAEVPPPFWAFAWPGSQLLARALLDGLIPVAGRHVLDFACGCGLAGIAAARAGAAHVTAIDIDPYATAATAYNAAHAGVHLDTRTVNLLTGAPTPPVDLILIGDLCYERDLVAPLLHWAHTQSANGVEVLLCDPGRQFCPADGVELFLEKTLSVDKVIEGRGELVTRILRVQSQPPTPPTPAS